MAGTESAQANLVPAVPPLNTVHCRLYTCAGATRDEYIQLRTNRDEYLDQPLRPMLLAQKAVWRSALVCFSSILESTIDILVLCQNSNAVPVIYNIFLLDLNTWKVQQDYLSLS